MGTGVGVGPGAFLVAAAIGGGLAGVSFGGPDTVNQTQTIYVIFTPPSRGVWGSVVLAGLMLSYFAIGSYKRFVQREKSEATSPIVTSENAQEIDS
jgi:hypothetical protein